MDEKVIVLKKNEVLKIILENDKSETDLKILIDNKNNDPSVNYDFKVSGHCLISEIF